MIDDLTALACGLLGPQVAVVAGRVMDLQGPLWPGEDARLARAVQSRRADFTAGRTAARHAMALMGLPPLAILQGPDGAPVWPVGLVGSLTHGGGVCVAAIARGDAVRSLGIDLERAYPLDPTLVAEICTQAERDWIATQSDAGDLPLRIFSAKEATYKAMYPLTGMMMDFTALDVRIDRDRAAFSAGLNSDHGPFTNGTTFMGGQGTVDGYVLSTLCLPVKPL